MGHKNQNEDTNVVSAPVGINLKKTETKEAEIQRLVLEERMRLEKEYGVEAKKIDHFKRPLETTFTKDQRANTTILFGGLTWKHEKLVKGVLQV
jgi:hypothetical protein